MKVPCATPGDVIEQVGEVMRLVSRVLVAWLYARSMQPVSEGDRPVPKKVTVDSSDEFVADRVRVEPEEKTRNTACAKSPTLGAQPLLPWQPVTSITYWPGETFPIMKLPFTTPVPTAIAQPADPVRTGL